MHIFFRIPTGRSATFVEKHTLDDMPPQLNDRMEEEKNKNFDVILIQAKRANSKIDLHKAHQTR